MSTLQIYVFCFYDNFVCEQHLKTIGYTVGPRQKRVDWWPRGKGVWVGFAKGGATNFKVGGVKALEGGWSIQ